MIVAHQGITLESQNAQQLFLEALTKSPFNAVPDAIRCDGQNLIDADPKQLIQKCMDRVVLSWGDFDDGQTLILNADGAIGFYIEQQYFGERSVLDYIRNLDWQVATFNSIHPEWGSDFDYYAPGFGSPLGILGWGCAFKGEGHNRVVSRRFLQFNPWRVIRDEEHDITLIQFHDLEADAKTALEQARVGHEILGDPYTGGFIQKNYSVNNPDFSGLYSSEEKMLRFVIADREITKAEMLDACAIRLYQLLGKDQPVERLAFVFAYSSEFAKPYLHDLWLREIEVWAIDKGIEHRLDLDYKPILEKLAWVVALEKT